MDYAPDEFILLILGLVLGIGIWPAWYRHLLMRQPLTKPNPIRWMLLFIPVGIGSLLLFILIAYSSPDVRTSFQYILLYWFLGLAWIRCALWAFPYFGISLRDDVIERSNPGAVYGMAGAVIGLMFCYAGGNIGQGPSWIVVVISAGLATVAFFALWFLLNSMTNITENVTVGRDTASGLRLGAFLLAVGIVLGRAVAGDWISLDATLIDFVTMSWPTLAILVLAVFFEQLAQPTAQQPIRPLVVGLVPSIIYVGTALGLVMLLPPTASLPR